MGNTLTWLIFLYALAAPRVTALTAPQRTSDKIDTAGLQNALDTGGVDGMLAALSAMHPTGDGHGIPKETEADGEVVYDFTKLQEQWAKPQNEKKKPKPIDEAEWKKLMGDDKKEGDDNKLAATAGTTKTGGRSPVLLKKRASTKS